MLKTIVVYLLLKVYENKDLTGSAVAHLRCPIAQNITTKTTYLMFNPGCAEQKVSVS